MRRDRRCSRFPDGGKAGGTSAHFPLTLPPGGTGGGGGRFFGDQTAKFVPRRFECRDDRHSAKIGQIVATNPASPPPLV